MDTEMDLIDVSVIIQRLFEKFPYLDDIKNFVICEDKGIYYIHFEWDGEKYYVYKDFEVRGDGNSSTQAHQLLKTLLRGR